MLPEELLAKASGSFQLQSAFLMYPYDPYVVKKLNNGFEKKRLFIRNYIVTHYKVLPFTHFVR